MKKAYFFVTIGVFLMALSPAIYPPNMFVGFAVLLAGASLSAIGIFFGEGASRD